MASLIKDSICLELNIKEIKDKSKKKITGTIKIVPAKL